MPRPRKHEPERILDATRELVLSAGARAASIEAIAGASGAPVGTLYHRFGSRTELLAEVWLRALERFQLSYLQEADEALDPVDAGVGMATAVVRFARRHPADAQLLLRLRRRDLFDADTDGALRERLDAMNEPLEKAVRRLARALHGRAGAREVARTLLVVVDLPYGALRRHAREGKVPAWLEEEVAELAHTLLSASAARTRSRPPPG